MAYALGKFAKALCDRCAFEYKLHELKEEWNGLKVCSDCYEPKHPQLEPITVKADPEALYKPRPNNDLEVGEGFVVVTYTDITKGNSMDPNTIGSNFVSVSCTASVGELLITQNIPSNRALPEGVSATSELGNVSVTGTTVDETLTSLASTASLGTVSVNTTTVTTYTTTVATGTNSYGTGNKFYIDGSVSPTLNLTEGQTYKFDQSDSSNSTHPLRFSTTANGTHAGGSEYTTGVTTNGTPGSSGAYTQITVASGAPTLYYYCTNHSGMGGTANTP
tara:strand:- start:686 stop:1516 length:831 start_codon:yes stop_codon:yes gene_type:complete